MLPGLPSLTHWACTRQAQAALDGALSRVWPEPEQSCTSKSEEIGRGGEERAEAREGGREVVCIGVVWAYANNCTTVRARR